MKKEKAIRILIEIKRQYEDCVNVAKSPNAESFQIESLKDNEDAVKTLDMAINTMEKQIPKAMIYKTTKIKDYESESYQCPICKWHVECGDKYCKKCGQSLCN